MRILMLMTALTFSGCGVDPETGRPCLQECSPARGADGGINTYECVCLKGLPLAPDHEADPGQGDMGSGAAK